MVNVNPNEFGRRFVNSDPVFGTLLVSQEIRTNFQALERGNDLRSVLGTTVNPVKTLALWIEPGSYATDGSSTKFWAGGFTPDYGTAGWPSIVNPVQYRTDTVVINSVGNIVISIGSESPTPPPASPYPSDCVPIVEVTILQGIAALDDSNVTIRDVRPMYVTSAAGFGINPKEETQYAASGQHTFNLATITYTPGNSELNVYMGGVRKNPNEDYIESSTTSITFIDPATLPFIITKGLPLNEKVTVWKVGAASAHRLADLDDVSVDQANAVIDPLGVRFTLYSGPSFSGTFLANANNPFATLADVSNVVGTIPFGVQHIASGLNAGKHGPTVTIDQTADNPTLKITKANVGGSFPVVLVDNSDSVPALQIMQTGVAPGVLLQQSGSADALQISYLSTVASVAPIAVLRTVSTAREPLITLRANTTGGLGANISILGNELTFANQANVRTFTFDVATATLSITGSSDSPRVVINHPSAGGGKSLEVIHVGANDAVRINNSGSAYALTLNNTSTNTILVVKGTATANLEPLWGSKFGSPTYADAHHTHLPAALNAGTGIALAELNDVDSNLANAVIDTGSTASPHRSSLADADNPLAIMADIQVQIPRIKTGSYTGNGTSQSISIGFQPDWVQLYNDGDNTQSGVYIARGSTGRFFKVSGAANVTITPTGFTLNDGTNPINYLGNTYHYVAFKSNI